MAWNSSAAAARAVSAPFVPNRVGFIPLDQLIQVDFYICCFSGLSKGMDFALNEKMALGGGVLKALFMFFSNGDWTAPVYHISLGDLFNRLAREEPRRQIITSSVIGLSRRSP